MTNSIGMVMDRSLVKFFAGIRTEQTRKDYERYLNYFLKFVRIKESGGLLQLKDSALQEMVEDFVINLKNRRLSRSYIDGQIAGLELFFAMNDKVLNWKKIKKMTPARKKPKGDKPYTTEEVRRMLELTNSLRNKAVIHFMASTGCRIGAIPNLRLLDLAEMQDGCKSVMFYRGEPEEYVGFLTPEASRVLDFYITRRRNDGEYIDDNSPVFREAYKVGIGKVRPMTLKAVRNMICDLVIKIHGRIGRNNHRDIAMTHGFRKRFDTILKDSSLGNIALKEKLMGHATKLIPLDTTYHSPEVNTLFGEFRLHFGELSIDESERERVRRIEAEKRVSELEQKQDEVNDLKRKVANLEKLMDKIL